MCWTQGGQLWGAIGMKDAMQVFFCGFLDALIPPIIPPWGINPERHVFGERLHVQQKVFTCSCL